MMPSINIYGQTIQDNRELIHVSSVMCFDSIELHLKCAIFRLKCNFSCLSQSQISESPTIVFTVCEFNGSQ